MTEQQDGSASEDARSGPNEYPRPLSRPQAAAATTSESAPPYAPAQTNGQTVPRARPRPRTAAGRENHASPLELAREPDLFDDLDPPAEGAVRLGMWGAAGGGKTSFLSAVQLATYRGCTEPGNWTIVGRDVESNDFLAKSVIQMTQDRKFPDASVSKQWIKWRLTGTSPAPARFAFRAGKRKPEIVQFDLQVLDSPGSVFLDPESLEPLLASLTEADGLVYLFDPTLDMDLQDGGGADEHNHPNPAYFYHVLNQLRARLDTDGMLDGNGRLPHHIAVCVTKFDDPTVFGWANESGLVTTDPQPPYLPRVIDPQAFFRWMCDRLPRYQARVVYDALTNVFAPDRTRFYVVSSIGFKIENGVFDAADPANVVIRDGLAKIVGDIHPMNVLEPLIQLERKIRTGSWTM
jgi:hypothetical protein